MATFNTVPIEEARRASLPPRKQVAVQYRNYLHQLVESGGEVAGRLELGEDDKSITERARLKSAAKAEGVNIHIQRRGSTIMFWAEDLDRGEQLSHAEDVSSNGSDDTDDTDDNETNANSNLAGSVHRVERPNRKGGRNRR